MTLLTRQALSSRQEWCVMIQTESLPHSCGEHCSLYSMDELKNHRSGPVVKWMYYTKRTLSNALRP